jgi:small subunit ribosomal protein S16
VSVKIRLKRMGKIRAPYYRIVVADSRTKRDGRAIEEIGKYHPTEDPSYIEVDSARAQYWLGVGAQPTEQVLAILKVTGDWQTFKGLPGAEGTLRTATPKADKRAVFEAAAKESMGDAKEATTPARGGRGAKKAAAPVAAAEPAAPAPAAPATPEPAAPEPVAAEPVAAEPVVAEAAAPEPAAEAAAPEPEPEAAAPEPETAAPEPETAAPEPAVEAAAAPATAEPAASEQPADAADEGAPGGSETSAQVEGAGETAQAEG